MREQHDHWHHDALDVAEPSVPAGSIHPAREAMLRRSEEVDQEPAPLTKGQVLRLSQILGEHLRECRFHSEQIVAAGQLLAVASMPTYMEGCYQPTVDEAWRNLDRLPILTSSRTSGDV